MSVSKPQLPSNYAPEDVEARWRAHWQGNNPYAYDPTRGRDETFVVDTPPPTVSGSLHMGHIFSYSHQDFIVRFQRMRGKNIFFPIGWDDNGLPTERRVQNLFNVKCEPHVHYDPNFKAERGKKGDYTPISRKNFIELCDVATKEDEEVFRNLWQRMGMSYDWDQEYATVNEHCRKISQLSFLELLEKGEAYQAERPVLWDVDFRTAIAQAELVDKEVPSAYHFLRFGIEGSSEHLVIATTRPELLPACVAVLVHPDDERYAGFIGKNAITPLFHAPVPIKSDPKADPEKGTGVVMVCTFGDQTDVEWVKTYGLPTRQVLDRDGHLLPIKFVSPKDADAAHRFVSVKPDEANHVYSQIQGKYAKQAQKLIVEIANTTDGVIDRPKQDITHAVKYFEKGDRPLELIPARQWFTRIMEHKDALVGQGRKIAWHPAHMSSRYENWVLGLNQDWCLSRQRFFGVPIPVWYKLGENGEVLHDQVLTPRADQLPIDPLDDVPEGYTADQRDVPGGFTGDPDVFDTWATSSLTPQIATGGALNPERHKKLFPMDVRPQSHEIIRTWAFYTIVKAYLHENEIPWKNVVISGWILDPDRKKMSKSQGNVVTPEPLIDQFGADCVRYWAGRARTGVDTAFDEQVFKVGKRLATKLFNATKFVLGRFEGIDPGMLGPERITHEMDRAVIRELRPLIERATAAFEQFDYAQSLQLTEDFFWSTFCDNYVELSKPRTYEEELSEGRLSAASTLRLVLRALLRMFAPFMPFLTEEIWHWAYAGDADMNESIHRSAWPALEEFAVVAEPSSAKTYEIVCTVVESVRKAKAEKNLSMKAPVKLVTVRAEADSCAALSPAIGDVRGMLHIEALQVQEGAVQNSLAEIAIAFE
ncbi:MAG TPA: valine--tRNA ligase, partial [Candidatus Hydrogenedentes bacterium]|nr:valine--tRNA ligase [Candidatus Hydrogenedentota bacterium]